MNQTHFYRLPEVLDALRISRTTAYRLMAKGVLVPTKIGRGLRFPVAEVERIIKNGTKN